MVGKNYGPILSRVACVDQCSWNFDTVQGAPCSFQRPSPIVYVLLRTEDTDC